MQDPSHQKHIHSNIMVNSLKMKSLVPSREYNECSIAVTIEIFNLTYVLIWCAYYIRFYIQKLDSETIIQ